MYHFPSPNLATEGIPARLISPLDNMQFPLTMPDKPYVTTSQEDWLEALVEVSGQERYSLLCQASDSFYPLRDAILSGVGRDGRKDPATAGSLVQEASLSLGAPPLLLCGGTPEKLGGTYRVTHVPLSYREITSCLGENPSRTTSAETSRSPNRPR